MAELSGITAIVTGGAHGIGAGIAKVLAQEGAQVAVTDIDSAAAAETAAQISEAGGRAIGLAHDVTQPDSCAEVVAKAREDLGPVDVLVNNAGISQRIAFAELGEADWDRMIAINLKGVYLMCRAVLDQMV